MKKINKKSKINKEMTFRKSISDLNRNDLVRSMKTIKHHKNTSCYEHSIRVSYLSYKIAKSLKLDCVSAARGAFLHDFYLYDWHNKDSHVGLHGTKHSKIALENANKITTLNHIEIDIIQKHMWPLNIKPPRYLESWIVQAVDKVLTLKEIII